MSTCSVDWVPAVIWRRFRGASSQSMLKSEDTNMVDFFEKKVTL